MPQTMSLHDKLAIRMKAIELGKQGKHEEAEKLEKSIPLPPYQRNGQKPFLAWKHS